jgi:hypothetical protein
VKAFAAVIAVAYASLHFAAPGAGDTVSLPARAPTTGHLFEFGSGGARRVFTVRQPSGVVLLTRLTVTHGIRAWATATIPNVSGVRVSTIRERGDPLSPCRRRARFDVCTQSQEWCPMPAAVWRVLIVKVGGPAGLVRFDFVVGKPPR